MMVEQTNNLEEVGRLAGLLLESALGLDDRCRLEKILISDDVALAYYENYVELHSLLHWQYGLSETSEFSIQQSAPRLDSITSLPSSTPFSFLSSAVHGTIDYFSHEILFSFLIGALLTGLLMLIAWLVPVSGPVEIAKTPSSLPTVVDPKTELVGRITGMVDCKWADPQTETVYDANVRLGRRYALHSGLMEITYATGAKVILQGPVTYKVESRNGGFISVGKLTGTVEVEKAKGFVVRTPTAVVTDLGTEFGVLVQEDQSVEVQVFRGLVEIQRRDGVGKTASAKPMRLSAGEGVRVTRNVPQIARLEADASAYPSLPHKSSSDLILYYPFDNLIESLMLWAPDNSGFHRSLALQGVAKDNLLPGKSGKAIAFNVGADNGIQCGTIAWTPAFDFADQSFTFALWLNRRAPGVEEHEIILAKELFDQGIPGGYAILYDKNTSKLVFRVKSNGIHGWNAWIPTGTQPGQDDAPIGQWVHLAVVGQRDSRTKLYAIRVYRNGQPVAEKPNVSWSIAQVPLRFCAQANGWAFCGLLDDVRLYRRALSDRDVQHLFTHPGSSPTDDASGNGKENR